MEKTPNVELFQEKSRQALRNRKHVFRFHIEQQCYCLLSDHKSIIDIPTVLFNTTKYTKTLICDVSPDKESDRSNKKVTYRSDDPLHFYLNFQKLLSVITPKNKFCLILDQPFLFLFKAMSTWKLKCDIC